MSNIQPAPSEESVPAPPKAAPWWLWLIGGALYGLAIRLLFMVLPRWFPFMGVMSASFLIGTPIAVGALTIYLSRRRNPPFLFCIFAPWLTVLLMMAGFSITLIEGSICIVLMSPLFLILGSVGGILMGLAVRTYGLNGSTAVVAILPLLLVAPESGLILPTHEQELRQSIHVNSDARTIWKQILSARSIRPDELPFSLTHSIGVPRPVEGVNRLTPEGEVRFSIWERGVNFRAVVTDRHEYQTIRWDYRFDGHSFPEGSMDEHVAIGGRYFDLLDTRFNLREQSNGSTDLEIVAHYRVTSRINFYAVPAAQLLGRDFLYTILGLYKGRSENAYLAHREK